MSTEEKVRKHYQGPHYRYRLRARMIEAGHHTLSLFAEEAGLPVGSLSRIVRGYEFPRPDFQEKIAAALGITVDDLADLLREEEANK